MFPGAITDIAGLSVGHWTDTRRPTGCTVLLCPQGAVAGVDVRGAAPGTRETDLLHPLATLELLGQCFVDKAQYAVAGRVLDRALNLPGAADGDLKAPLVEEVSHPRDQVLW